MDIIFSIGLVIAGLVILWAIIAGVFGYLAKRSFDKFSAEIEREHDTFRKLHGFK